MRRSLPVDRSSIPVRWSTLFSYAAALVVAVGMTAGCSGNQTSAGSTSTRAITTTTSPVPTTPAEVRVALADLKPAGDQIPDVKKAAVDGVTVGRAMYIGTCYANSDPIFNYRVPLKSSSFTATIAMGDRSAQDSQAHVEFFVNDIRAAVVDPRLGSPARVTLDVSDAATLSVRVYPYRTDECGESRGIVLASAEFSTLANPAAAKRTEDPSAYTVETETVSAKCDSFDLKSDHKPMPLNGQTSYHALSAGRKDNLGDAPGPCGFEYNLARSAKKLTAVAGVIDDSTSTFTCRIEISADGKSLFNKDLALGSTEPVDIPVDNVLRLRVEFTFLGKGYGQCALGDFRIFRSAAK
ncbi:hypothetical protein GCM10010198_70620 [Nocardia seriolae]|nr:hypothetical protein NSERKGN1266_53200 [Nocardia seriolae]BEK95012.1 hypothetical protein NSER024013_29180 [Nocardia seriolae]GEM28916.1 hypothetical protein NS2_71550 [Nocardia seriolae NBRC 15557]